MNKRQRKKHRIGEFQELGFELSFQTPENWSIEEQLTFYEECIKQAKVCSLEMAGGVGTQWSVFVFALKERATVSAVQRGALLEWLAVHPSVTDIKAGPLVDAWHPKSVTL